MGTIFGSLFRSAGKTEKRMSVDDWAHQWFTYQGHGYPILGRSPKRDKSESIENDFAGYVGAAYKSNGIVFACMVARQFVFTEARFGFQFLNESGRPGDDIRPLAKGAKVLEKPWLNGTTGELLARAIQDIDLAGNHFVVREGVGENARLRRLRPDWVEILLTAPPDEAVESDVEGYIYKPGGSPDPKLWKFYPADGSNGQIAHWSPIPDPEAQYRGMSWLTPVLREVMSDKAATLHKAKFFENGATPNLVFSLSDQLTKEQFDEFMATVENEKTGVENAYENLYVGGGADVTVVGSDLRQLDFRASQGAGETRIAAAARVHPVVVGLSEGMQGSSLNAGNFRAAKDAFADGTLRPLWRSLCAAYEALVEVPEGARLWYDDRDISFLREDRKEVTEIQREQAATISSLIMQGFTNESAVEAVVREDWRLLVHTGLFSVQLQPPGADNNNDGKGDNIAGPKGKANPSPGAPKTPAGGKPAAGGGGKAAPSPKTAAAPAKKPAAKPAPKQGK